MFATGSQIISERCLLWQSTEIIINAYFSESRMISLAFKVLWNFNKVKIIWLWYMAVSRFDVTWVPFFLPTQATFWKVNHLVFFNIFLDILRLTINWLLSYLIVAIPCYKSQVKYFFPEKCMEYPVVMLPFWIFSPSTSIIVYVL